MVAKVIPGITEMLSDTSPETYTDSAGGGVDGGEIGSCAEGTGVGTACAGGAWHVKRGHVRIASINSGMVILRAGSRVKILTRMSFSSSDTGRMVFRNSGLRRYARYVESSKEACFHGLRPQVRFTKITPSDQTSLGAQ